MMLAERFRIAKQATAEATRAVLIATAKREHARVMTDAPRPLSFQRFVDGAAGAREEAVRANGVIHYRYGRLNIVAEFALETLRELSPVGPPEGGHYRDAHTLFLNGSPVVNLAGWEAGDEVVIANPMPYARKIEIGSMRMTVPGTSRVYDMASRKVAARFRSIASISFSYRSIAGGRGKDGRYPAIVIRDL